MSSTALKTRPKKLALAISMALAGSANVSATPMLLELVGETVNVSGNADTVPPSISSGPYDKDLMQPDITVDGSASAANEGIGASASSSANTGGGYRARASVNAFGGVPVLQDAGPVLGPQAGVASGSGNASASVLFSQSWQNVSGADVDVDLSFLIDDGRLSVEDFGFFPGNINAASVNGPFAAGVGGFSGTAEYDFDITVQLPGEMRKLLDSAVTINGTSIVSEMNGLGMGNGSSYNWGEQLKETMFSLGAGQIFTFTADLTVSATGMLDGSCFGDMIPGGMNGGVMEYSPYGDGCEGNAFAGNGDPVSLVPQLTIDAMPASVPEPGTLALLGISAAAAAGSRRKRRR